MKILLIAILIALPLTASADYYQDYANYQKQMLIQQQQLLNPSLTSIFKTPSFSIN